MAILMYLGVDNLVGSAISIVRFDPGIEEEVHVAHLFYYYFRRTKQQFLYFIGECFASRHVSNSFGYVLNSYACKLPQEVPICEYDKHLSHSWLKLF
jgi:hypothetical protein